MSIPTKEQVGRFLAPLRGNLTIILLHDIQTKTRLSHFLLRCASLESVETTVLDTDVFYCTNIDRLAEGALSPGMTELLLLPERGFEVSSLLPLLSSKRELIIIDDLNSLYSLASEERKAHQLAILMRLLSHNARVNGSWVIATAFRTDLGAKQGAQNLRSLTTLGDLLVDTDFKDGALKLESKGLWEGNALVA